MSRTSRRRFLVGSLTLAGTGLLPAGPAAAVALPPIIDCAGWGARPNSAIVPVWNQRPVKIIVHHTATPNTDDLSRGGAEYIARTIQNFHMDRRGWIDTGQHFTISRGGFVLEGRHRSLEVLRTGRRQVEGAHCTGQNILAVGIENEGTYTEGQPPPQLWDRLRELCAYICQQYGIRPTEIYGHRDFKDTACPGDAFYPMLPRLRTEVAGALGQRLSRTSAVSVSWPLLRIADRGPTVLAAQHLLRAAGDADVAADGEFDRRTADAVRRLQTAHRTEEVNGMVGGESWPLLVALAARADAAEVARAVQALNDGRPLRQALRGQDDWQQLLDANTRR
jgi:N-acetyl-anhydromuramyl-L-alanine amidase AmpD